MARALALCLPKLSAGCIKNLDRKQNAISLQLCYSKFVSCGIWSDGVLIVPSIPILYAYQIFVTWHRFNEIGATANEQVRPLACCAEDCVDYPCGMGCSTMVETFLFMIQRFLMVMGCCFGFLFFLSNGHERSAYTQ